MYYAIILAAGTSSRFKSNKLLSILNGKKLIERTLEPFIELNNTIKKICVVTGADYDEINSLFDNSGVDLVHNPKYMGGMSSSVKIGLECLKDRIIDFEGIFIHPGDIPFILKEDLLMMIDHLNLFPEKIVIPSYVGKKGHPLLVPPKYIDDMLKIDERSEGLRGFLKNNHKHIKFVIVENQGILRDIDYPEDLEED